MLQNPSIARVNLKNVIDSYAVGFEASVLNQSESLLWWSQLKPKEELLQIWKMWKKAINLEMTWIWNILQMKENCETIIARQS